MKTMKNPKLFLRKHIRKKNLFRIMKRLCIDAKEVAIVLGKSMTTAQTILRTIKDAHGKKKYQPVTIKEFCAYMALPFDEIYAMINKIKQSDRDSFT